MTGPEQPSAPPVASNPKTTPQARPDWRTLHLWHIQPVRDILVILLVLGVLWLGYKLSTVTVPMLLALLLAYLLEPLVRRMTRLRTDGKRVFSRGGVALLFIVLVFVLVVVPVTIGLGYATVQGASAVVQLGENVGKLKAALDSPDDTALRDKLGERTSWRWIYDQLHELVDVTPDAPRGPPAEADAVAPGEGVLKPAEEPDESSSVAARFFERLGTAVAARDDLRRMIELGSSWLKTNADTLSKQVLGAGQQAVGAAARGFGWLGMLAFSGFLTAFFFYFFCTGYGKLLRFWESLIPERRKGRAVDLLDQMDRVIAGFVRGRLTICVILIVYYTIAYAIIGVPAWTVIGPVVGVLTLVPYAASAAVPAIVILLWLNAGGEGMQSAWWFIVGAPILVLVIQQLLDDYLLTPKIQGDATGMDIPSILFASIAGGILAGVYGLLLAIPVAACIKILLKETFWPRVKAWAEGTEEDILPIGRD